MKFLEQSEFLDLFSKPKPKVTTLTEFKRVARVRVGNTLKPLAVYSKEKGIPTEEIALLYENIHHRNEYLNRFYQVSLQLPDTLDLSRVPPMKNKEMDNNQALVYKNVIRNLHYEGILLDTKSGIDENWSFLEMLANLYLHHIIDYKILTPSARFYMKNGRLGSVFSSYYFRASIMNPHLVYSLNMSVLKGSRIFTPTLGWSSYCYGFLYCPDVKEYVGTDVIPSVCRKTKAFAKHIRPEVKTEIYCQPSEKLFASAEFKRRYREHFDVVFFSPPYYELELYEGGKQSTDMYTTYEEWLDKYWDKTIQLCHHVLEKDGRLCYILSGYGSENTGKYDLLGDMNRITKKLFRLKSSQPMYNKDVHVTTHKETAERILIFVKK
jgi:hypothetical protein